MYFPYFRGRQYELLALKELANRGLIGTNVIPVVEPIKTPTSTFINATESFDKAQLLISLIFNPTVGELKNGDAFEKVFVIANNNSCVIPTVLVNEEIEKTITTLNSRNVSNDVVLAIFNNRNYLETYKGVFGEQKPKYTLCPDKTELKRAVRVNKVLFEDKFIKKDRNADYPEDEFFSEDHLYYQDDGYIGFGDYSIIGNEYKEGGFAPYAVAIHIIYFASDDTLRIRHFISDSNNDTSDVAGKFHEAVSKLADWYTNGQNRQLTSALSTLLNHAKDGTYPGLPTIKKLSIMHHLELVSKYLDGGLK